MTLEEFKAEYSVREGDTVHECRCGAMDCPGWKIITPEMRTWVFTDTEEALIRAAERLGREMGKRAAAHELAVLKEVMKGRLVEGFFAQSEIRQVKKPVSLVPQCGACGLHKTCQSPKMAPGGRGERRILIVGEAPGKEEDAQNKHFVGEAGDRLRAALSKLNVHLRRDCWTTNAIICRPPRDMIHGYDVVDYCRPNLIKTLRELKPSIIIPLGDIAARSLFGHVWKEDDFGGIERWAGMRIPSQKPNVWICPTFSPSFVLGCERDDKKPAPHVGVLFERHLGAAMGLAGRPWDKPPDFPARVRCITDPKEAARQVRKLAERDCLQSIDYETTTLKPTAPKAEIVACAISDGEVSYAFPWAGEAREAVSEWCRCPCPKVVSNLQFEENWTWKEFGHGVTNWDLDTMLTAHWADNREGICSIKFQAYTLLGVPSWNDHIEPFLKADGPSLPNRIKQISIKDLLLYVGLDALYELLAAHKMKELYPQLVEAV